jgi:hypothetical protein
MNGLSVRACNIYIVLGRWRSAESVSGGNLRITISLILTIFLLLVWGCSSKPNNPQVVKINDGVRYFPVQQGNKWFYNSGEYNRLLDGDTTISGTLCLRLLQNGETEEAWTLTSERFAQHLLAGFLWFDPPLQIPLNLEKDKPFQTSALGRIALGFVSPIDSARFAGNLTFTGYSQREVVDVMLDSCIGLHYNMRTIIYNHSGVADTTTDIYDEYYARGIGLVLLTDPKDTRYLDSAIIGGVKVP